MSYFANKISNIAVIVWPSALAIYIWDSKVQIMVIISS